MTLRGYGRDLCRPLQFRRNPQVAQSFRAWPLAKANRVWSLEEIVMMADSYFPKPGKRGPYKKSLAI